MRHILVTGGGGYVGAAVVPRLLERGHRVRVIDRFWFSDPEIFSPHPRLQLVTADLRDSCRLRENLYGVDTVLHLAGIHEHSASGVSPELLEQVNGEAHRRLVENSRRAGVRRFVFLSSISIYGKPDGGEIRESTPVSPDSPFTRLLQEAEREVLGRGGQETFSTAVVRSSPVWGPSARMRWDLALNRAIQDVQMGRVAHLGPRRRRYPCIHIDDVTELLTLTVERPADLVAGQVFHACSHNPTWEEVGRELTRRGAGQVEYETDGPEGPSVSADWTRRRMGYCPRTTLAVGLDRAGIPPSRTRESTVPTPKRPEQIAPRDDGHSYTFV